MNPITLIKSISKKTKLDVPLETGTMLFPCGMSRSGTTLLATILDSHSQVSLGYELIPPELPGPLTLKSALDEGLMLSDGDFETCGNALRKSGQKNIGLFMRRCCRAGISENDLRSILDDMHKEGVGNISTFEERLAVAWRISKKKSLKEGTTVYGFKLNSPSVERAHKLFPGGYFIYIIRDPRDVVASHIKRGFDRTTEEICKAWNNYITSFEKFHLHNSDISLIIRYEDLVSKPHETIERIFNTLPLNIEEEVFRFYESKASVHQGGHPNADALKQNFFTSSIDRWKEELIQEVIDLTKVQCKEKMIDYQYA